MTDLSTVLLAVLPSTVTGVVAYQAARSQASTALVAISARLDEVERGTRAKRRDERADACINYLAAEIELHTRITSGTFEDDWYRDWAAEKYNVCNAAISLLASDDVFDASNELYANVQESLVEARESLAADDGTSLGAEAQSAYQRHRKNIADSRRKLRQTMRDDIV